MPGDAATCASVTSIFENSSEPMWAYGSGTGAQTNIVPFGFGKLHPIWSRPSHSTSRRDW